MHTVFTSKGGSAVEGFKRWLTFSGGNRKLATHTLLDARTFDFTIETTGIGPLRIDRISSTPQRVDIDGRALQQAGRSEHVAAYVILDGTNGGTQYERESRQGPGDIVLYDGISSHAHIGAMVRFLMFEIPRKRLEDIIGSSRAFTSITIPASLGTAALAVNFLCDLIDRSTTLDGASLKRMADVAVELIIAAAAERFQHEPKLAPSEDLTIYKAKTYIRHHLSDFDLNPSQVAAATGVSLRHLQWLFQQIGQGVAEWIWDQRLITSAKLLGEPSSRHRLIADIAFDCGFINQSHFSTKFKDKFGTTPRAHRDGALLRH